MKKAIVALITIVIVGNFLLSSVPIGGQEEIMIENPILAKYRVHENNYLKEIYENIFQPGWPQIFDAGPEDSASAVAVDSNQNIIVTGYTGDVDTMKLNFLTVKYDSDGNLIWNKTYDSGTWDFAWDLAVDSEDSILILGFNYTSRDEVLNHDYRVIKYDENGVLQWAVSIPGLKENYPGGIAVDSQDNVIITGGYGDLDLMEFNCWTMKFNKDGEKLWDATFNEDLFSFGADVVVNPNNDIFVAGMSAGFFSQGYILIKYDANGNQVWVGRYKGNQCNGISIDTDENLILAGQGYSSESNSSTWYTIKCDKDGNLLWEKEFDTNYNEYASDVEVDSSGKVITVGAQFFDDNGLEHFGIIYDEDGEEICIKKTGVSGGLSGVAIDSDDRIVVAGSSGDPFNWNYYTDIYFDITPPSVELERPKAGFFYVFDREVLDLFKNAVVFGKITANIIAENPTDISKVEFYIDKELKESIDEVPYEWTWSDLSFGLHSLETYSYDHDGCVKRDEVFIWKFF